MPMVTLAGHDTYVTHFGQGPRKALLLHCSLAHSAAYGRLCAALGGALSITSFDQPGHGRSADFTGMRDLQDQVTEMALELMTEPMDLLGHSFGGTVAIRIAVERPDLVRTLTLFEPVMMAVAMHDQPALRDQLMGEMQGFNTAFDAGDHETAAREFTARYGDGRPWDSLSAESRAALVDRIHLIRAGARAVNEDYHGLLEGTRMARADMPCLVIDGGQGGPMMDGVCNGLVNRLPNATRVQIMGGGHMVPLTKPDPVAQEILRLVSLPQAQ